MRHVAKAVDLVREIFVTDFAAHLRAVEIADELDANTIPDPLAYLSVFTPQDHRSPLVMVDDLSMTPLSPLDGARSHLFTSDVGILIAYTSDARRDLGKAMLRRYITAAIDTIHAANLAGAAIILARVDTATDATKLPGQASASTRFYAMLELEIITHDPEAS